MPDPTTVLEQAKAEFEAAEAADRAVWRRAGDDTASRARLVAARDALIAAKETHR